MGGQAVGPKRRARDDRRTAVASDPIRFTITYHYLFPQLTMGLALLIVVLKALACATATSRTTRSPGSGPDLRAQFRRGGGDRHSDGVSVRDQLGAASPNTPAASSDRRWRWRACSRSFWNRLPAAYSSAAKSDWARAITSRRRCRSALGSWLSGYFIIVTNAFMQHPVGYRIEADGLLASTAFCDLPAQSLGIVAVRPQQMAAARVTALLRGCRRGALLSLRTTTEHADLPARGRSSGADLLPAGRVPDRRPAGQDGCAGTSR